jgi:nicotinamide phosphoribosyltransferase
MTTTQLTTLQQMVQQSSLEELYQNASIMTDFYKYSHHGQYPEELEQLFTYGEARAGSKYDAVVWTGLQMILKEELMNPQTIKQNELTQEWVKSAGGFDYFAREAWDRVVSNGYLPLSIDALPEWCVVPAGTPLFRITSEQWFAKHMNLLEGTLMHVWGTTTIASRELRIKERIRPYFEKSGCLELLPYAVNDFSYRGHVSPKEAVRKWFGHLIHFAWSDNVPADVIGVMKHYHGPQVLKSVWATEHSVAESFGPGEGEYRYLKTQLIEAPKDAIISIVIDTYGSRNFMDRVVGDPEVMQMIKDRPGRVVFRPDSGVPQDEVMMCLESLESTFGHTVINGYKVLNDNVGVILGDGINEETSVAMYEQIMNADWSAANLVLGAGSGLMAGVDRDTERFAIKGNQAILDGQTKELYKSPTWSSFKKSKPWEFKVVREDDWYKTYLKNQTAPEIYDILVDAMTPVFHNGQLIKDYTYDEVVANIEKDRWLYQFA